ncbi:unnamed protein product [Paramecium sonneborni]|uniref:Transmembrane protein n=1 Tax=Paramecium sonneborni TaxID=65129 RepID=A0A8S1LQF9_9CILI|nr:unnamed protein product [Paramecium sonneborni]
MQFLIAIPFILTVYTQSLYLEPLQYYSESFLPGTKITIKGDATQFCYVQQGKIVQNILNKSEFQVDAIAFTKGENETILILNSQGQLLNNSQNIISTIPKFQSKKCKILWNKNSIAIYCFDTQHLYIIQDQQTISEHQLENLKDAQIIQQKYIVLKGQELFFNYNVGIDSISIKSVDVFRIIDDKILVFVAQQNQTSVIYIYKFTFDQFVYNRRVILKKLYKNITSVLMTENEEIYITTLYQLIKYDGSEKVYEIRNVQNLYNSHNIVIAISNLGVFEQDDDQIELYNLMANPMQIMDLIIDDKNNYILSRQYMYQVTFSGFNSELICYPQEYHKSGVYKLEIKENDKKYKLIEIEIQQPIINSRNENLLWIGAAIFFVGILTLDYLLKIVLILIIIMYQLTKQLVDFRRNQFLNQGLQTEFTIQSENTNKLVSVGSQLKNLNNIEKQRYLKPESSYDESSGESSVMCEQNRQKRLNVDDVVSMVIDTECNQTIKLEAKPFQKNNRVEQEWESQKSIIIMNIDEEAIDNLDLNEFFDEQYTIL